MQDPSCLLCALAQGDIKTRLYYQDSICICVDCLTCKSPMMVYLFHSEPAPVWQRHMEDKARELFPGCSFRYERRLIKSHPHFHILT